MQEQAIFDDAKKALENDLLVLDYKKRISFLRGFLDFVIDQYEKAILDAARFAPFEDHHSKVAATRYDWLDPLPTPRQILAMSDREASQYQGVCRFKDGTYWITHDSRFIDDGRGMKFHQEWLKAARARAPSENEAAESERIYDLDKRPSSSLIENFPSSEEILEYEEKIKTGEVAVVIGDIMTRELLNSYKCPMQIDGQEWPTVEHYILAQQYTDEGLRERIRTGRTLTEIRKMIRKESVRSDWEQVRDQFMRKALEEKLKNEWVRANLINTIGFQIRCKGDPYWGGTRNRLGELLMELRDKIYAQHQSQEALESVKPRR